MVCLRPSLLLASWACLPFRWAFASSLPYTLTHLLARPPTHPPTRPPACTPPHPPTGPPTGRLALLAACLFASVLAHSLIFVFFCRASRLLHAYSLLSVVRNVCAIRANKACSLSSTAWTLTGPIRSMTVDGMHTLGSSVNLHPTSEAPLQCDPCLSPS